MKSNLLRSVRVLLKQPKTSQRERDRSRAWALTHPERRKEISRRSYLKLRPPLKPIETPMQRFERLTERVPFSGCWLWTGAVNKDGYGKLTVDSKDTTAHRWSWQLHNGPIPNGLHVLHRCDVPGCVNPAHLFVGDTQANVDDMWAKGRRGKLRGGSMPNEVNPNAIFSDRQIAEMRKAREISCETNKALAKRFGISESHFSHVVRGLVRRARHV